MRRNDPVVNLMTPNPVAIQLGQPPSEARKLFTQNSFHHLPVLEKQTLVGVLSTNDFLKFSLRGWGTDDRTMDVLLDQQSSIQEMMTTNPVTLTVHSTVRDAAQLLNTGEYHSLPVVDDHGALLGIVTSTDLIRYLSSQY